MKDFEKYYSPIEQIKKHLSNVEPAHQVEIKRPYSVSTENKDAQRKRRCANMLIQGANYPNRNITTNR